MRIPSGVTDQVIYFVAVDSTDFTTRETGLSSFTVYRSRDGGTATAMTTPTVTEVDATNMPGVYKLLLDEDMTITAGNDSEEMVFHITQASMAPVTRTIELYRRTVTAGYTLGVGSDGDLLEVNTLTGHTVQTGDSYARLGAPAGASISVDVAAVKSDTAAILVDTAEIGTAGAGLTALATAAALATVDANVDAILVDTAEIGAAGAGLTALASAANLTTVDTVVDSILSMLDDARGEPGQGAPPVNPDMATKVDYLYKAWRNKKEQTSGTFSLYDDAGTTVDQKATTSDDGTTTAVSEMVSGP